MRGTLKAVIGVFLGFSLSIMLTPPLYQVLPIEYWSLVPFLLAAILIADMGFEKLKNRRSRRLSLESR